MIPIMSVKMGLNDDLMRYLAEIEEAGIYGNFGPQVHAMETEFSELVGVSTSQLVSVSNATLALQGAMLVLGCQTWVVPSWTFAATAHSALLQDAKVYFGDVQANSWALDPSGVESGEGAVVTAPFGAQVSIGQEWNHVSALVIDAAAAVGAFPVIGENFGRPWAIVVSLHATKVLGIGEGAFVVFSTAELASRFRQWTNFGFFGSREAESPGTNAKLSEVSAAIARLRLASWDEEQSTWRSTRFIVHELCDRLGLNPPFSSESWISPYWIVDLPSPDIKKRLVQRLALEGIETRDWWSSGCHTMRAFANTEYRKPLEVTEHLASVSLGLPYFRSISERELATVGTILRQVVDSE